MALTIEMLRKQAAAGIDTLEKLRALVEWNISIPDATYKSSLDYTFECCPQLYKQDLELFKKVVKYYFVNNNLNFDDVFRYCSDILESLPDLHKALTNYVNSQNDVHEALV